MLERAGLDRREGAQPRAPRCRKVTMSALSGARTLAIIETQNAIAAASLPLAGVIKLVVSRAQQITSAAGAAVALIEGDEMVYDVVSGGAESFIGMRWAVQTSVSGRCLLQNEVVLCEDAEIDPKVDRDACLRVRARSILCAPLICGERVVGVLEVCAPEAHVFGEDDVTTLRVLSGIIAAAMTHAGELELQRHHGRQDRLTGLPNRRAFDEQLEREVARAKRYGGRLTLCLADLDFRRAINDRQGHASGDAALRAVAAILKRLRDTDQAFRFGGDRFAMIFPGVDYVSARSAVCRAQTAVEREPTCLGAGLRWGLADLSDDDAQTLVLRADAALCKAKANGAANRLAGRVQL